MTRRVVEENEETSVVRVDTLKRSSAQESKRADLIKQLAQLRAENDFREKRAAQRCIATQEEAREQSQALHRAQRAQADAEEKEKTTNLRASMATRRVAELKTEVADQAVQLMLLQAELGRVELELQSVGNERTSPVTVAVPSPVTVRRSSRRAARGGSVPPLGVYSPSRSQESSARLTAEWRATNEERQRSALRRPAPAARKQRTTRTETSTTEQRNAFTALLVRETSLTRGSASSVVGWLARGPRGYGNSEDVLQLDSPRRDELINSIPVRYISDNEREQIRRCLKPITSRVAATFRTMIGIMRTSDPQRSTPSARRRRRDRNIDTHASPTSSRSSDDSQEGSASGQGSDEHDQQADGANLAELD